MSNNTYQPIDRQRTAPPSSSGRGRRWRAVLVLGASLTAAVPGALAEWSEWIADVDVRLAHQQNINYSAFSNDKLSDSALIPSASFGRYLQLGNATRLRLTADVEAGKFDTYDRLDYTQLGATAALHHKYGLGSEAPWVRAQLSVASLNVDSDMRDSTIYEIGVQTGKRLAPRFDGQVGLAYRSRNGKNGPVVDPLVPTDVFDQDSVTVSLGGSYLVTENVALTFGYAHRRGEFDSTCTGGNVANVLAAEGTNVKALAFDDAYKLAQPMCAYKLDGKTNTFSFDVNYALGRQSSLRFGVERQDGKGDVLEYDNTIYRARFVYLY